MAPLKIKMNTEISKTNFVVITFVLILIITIVILAVYLAKCEKDRKNNEDKNTPVPQQAKFKIATKQVENMNIQEEIIDELKTVKKKPNKENMVVYNDLKRIDGVIQPPKDVQPGTLITPPIGYVRSPPLFDIKHGYKSNGPSAITIGDIPGVDEIMKKENMKAEKLIMDERGVTDHSFQSANNPVNAITGPTFDGTAKEWADLKINTKKAIGNISGLFDKIFFKVLFPNAQIRNIDQNNFKIYDQDSNKCIMIERYYQYVKSCIDKELGNSISTDLNWLEGSKVKLGFKHINESIPDLRKGILIDCASSSGYKNMPGNKVKNLSNDKMIFI